MLLGPEEEERPEDAEDDIGEEAEGREVDIKLLIVHPDREYFQEGKHGNAEDIDGAHVEVAALLELPEAADFICVDKFLAVPVPQHVFDMERISVRSFQYFPAIEFSIDDIQGIFFKKVIYEADADRFGEGFQLDSGK